MLDPGVKLILEVKDQPRDADIKEKAARGDGGEQEL